MLPLRPVVSGPNWWSAWNLTAATSASSPRKPTLQCVFGMTLPGRPLPVDCRKTVAQAIAIKGPKARSFEKTSDVSSPLALLGKICAPAAERGDFACALKRMALAEETGHSTAAR